MTTGTLPLEPLVYSHFHDIFRGQKAAYRKLKKVREVLSSPDTNQRVQNFCQQRNLSEQTVVTTIKNLLDERVFEDLGKAKLKFPQLFQLSVELAKEKENRESEAAVSEAGYIEAISVKEEDGGEGFDPPNSSSDDEFEPEEPVAVTTKKKRRTRANTITAINKPSVFAPPPSEILDEGQATDTPELRAPKSRKRKKGNISELEDEVPIAELVRKKTPKLFPVYLPYPVQHALTTEVQKVLEQACYDFVKAWLPDWISNEQFMHPQNAELPMWARLIKRKLKTLPAHAYDGALLAEEASLGRIISHIEDLRHTAVHRLKTQSKGLEQMLGSAVLFARTLKDERRTAYLEKILEKAKEASTELENEKIFMLNRLEKELEEIEQMRRQLRIREQNALAQILEDDRMARAVITIDLDQVRAEVLNGDIPEPVDVLDLTTTSDRDDGAAEIPRTPSQPNQELIENDRLPTVTADVGGQISAESLDGDGSSGGAVVKEPEVEVKQPKKKKKTKKSRKDPGDPDLVEPQLPSDAIESKPDDNTEVKYPSHIHSGCPETALGLADRDTRGNGVNAEGWNTGDDDTGYESASENFGDDQEVSWESYLARFGIAKT
ncbi:hypothetical protein ABW19_dt0202638 [Dactylella cylindrospora]|nr:hypothetical protein ABW19_dt0202638 [Dactylella cylindrospora]